MYIYLFIYCYIFIFFIHTLSYKIIDTLIISIFFIHTLSYKIIDTLIKLKYVCMYLQKEKNKVNFFCLFI